MASQIEEDDTPAWIKHMEARGYTVRRADPNYVYRPIENRPSDIPFRRAVWLFLQRIFGGKRAVR
jgi:hypothetical protein